MKKLIGRALLALAFGVCLLSAYVYGFTRDHGDIPMTAEKWQACEEGDGCALITRRMFEQMKKLALQPNTCGERT